MAYGASAFHKPALAEGPPRGIAKQLATEQSACLRVVAGAYRATPVRSLETETLTPPLDIYLNKGLADFEARLDRTGIRELIEKSCAAIAAKLRQRTTRGRPRVARPTSPGPAPQQWAAAWAPEGTGTSEAVLRDWKARWDQALQKADWARPFRDNEPADEPDFAKALDKHQGLQKHESSLLVQIRTGKIGLKAFLFARKVPTVVSPYCECGTGHETAAHIILECPILGARRQALQQQLPVPLRTRKDLAEATKQPITARKIVRWLLQTGRIQEFRVAESLTRSAAPAADPAAGPHGCRARQQ
jgi:hypothetical protein